MKKNNKGFSLVELIVVVLILGILAVAVTPQIMNWINKSKIAKDESYAGAVATAIESVTLEYVGKNFNSAIATKIEISKDTSATPNKVVLKGMKQGTTTFAAPITSPAPAKGSFDQYLLDVITMIGEDKLAVPEQSNMKKYIITITPNASTSTVGVKVEATN